MKRTIELLFLISFGVMLAVLFYVGAKYGALPGFRVPQYYYNADMKRLGMIFTMMAAVYTMFVFFVYLLRDFSRRSWMILVIGGFVIIGLLAVWSHPTGSQDLYWSVLLAKGLTAYHLNPYYTTPADLAFDPWSLPIETWRDLAMIYGPLWVGLLGLITSLSLTLSGTLIAVKLVALAALGVIEWLFWRITALHQLPLLTRRRLLLILAWNPVLFQLFVVDGHNDVYILFGIISSYYFFLRKHYALSITALVLAGLVKYVPWFAIPIPLYYWLREQPNVVRKLLVLVATVGGLIGIVLLAYWPFGLSADTLTGITNELTTRGTNAYAAVGTYGLRRWLHLSIGQTRLVATGVALLLMAWFIKQRKPLFAYTIPYLCILVFGATWFQPWYLLWMFPLLLLYFPIEVITLLTVFMLLTPTVATPSETFTVLTAVLIVYGVGYWVVRRKGFLLCL